MGRGLHTDRGHATHPGGSPLLRPLLDVLRGLVTHDAPLAPIHAAVHARLHAVDPGQVEASIPSPAPEGLDAALWVLSDLVTGVAVSSVLDEGAHIATLRLTLHVTRRDAGRGVLRATGTLDERDRSVALSRAVLRDDTGRPLARATARNAVFPSARGWGHPDVTWAVPARAAHTLVGPGGPDPAALNFAGTVQGGLLGWVAARALAEDLGGMPDEATATFLRAVTGDVGPLHTATVLEHPGRRLRSARTTLSDDGDRLLVTANGIRYAGS